MKIALTGATGFLGRYLVSRLVADGHRLTCWNRSTSDIGHFPTPLPNGSVAWIEGSLGDKEAGRELVAGADAVIHAALDHPTGGFRGQEGDLGRFLEANLMGSLALIELARTAGVDRFIFISSCAVHEKILADRPLDETHPLWPTSHYGAYKAAIEAFVHSYGLGHGFPICALRPTGIYGLAYPVRMSKWYSLVQRILEGRPVECHRGGKEVHAEDVARAVAILLAADPGKIAGGTFNCYDRYVSEFDVAALVQKIVGKTSTIAGAASSPRNQIVTTKLGALGMTYGGTPLLERTVQQMIDAARG
jgi:nucleoside-diphosphate-sugar epimerase